MGKLKTYCRKLSSINLKFPLLEAGVEGGDISELLNLRCHITFDALLTNSDFSHFPALHNCVQSVLFVPEKTLSSDCQGAYLRA